MKNPLASEIVKSVKSFVMGTMREHKDPAREPPAREDMGSRVRGFLKQTERRMQSSDHWKSEVEISSNSGRSAGWSEIICIVNS